MADEGFKGLYAQVACDGGNKNGREILYVSKGCTPKSPATPGIHHMSGVWMFQRAVRPSRLRRKMFEEKLQRVVFQRAVRPSRLRLPLPLSLSTRGSLFQRAVRPSRLRRIAQEPDRTILGFKGLYAQVACDVSAALILPIDRFKGLYAQVACD